jgi:hypothetical protein
MTIVTFEFFISGINCMMIFLGKLYLYNIILILLALFCTPNSPLERGWGVFLALLENYVIYFSFFKPLSREGYDAIITLPRSYIS